MTPDLIHALLILVLAALAWDVLRRFARPSGVSQEDLDELHAWIEGMGQEAQAARTTHENRLTATEARVAKHAETLNKLGLAKLTGAK